MEGNPHATPTRLTPSPVDHAFWKPGGTRGEHDEHGMVESGGFELDPDRRFSFLRPTQSFPPTTNTADTAAAAVCT